MAVHDFKKQLKTVIFIESILILMGVLFAKSFWERTCQTTLLSCLANKDLSLLSFLLLHSIRPFLLTPHSLFVLMSGSSYVPEVSTLISAIGAVFSCATLYFLAKAIGKKLVNPWLSSNLPQTLRFIRSQDCKLVLVCRFVPFMPFDVCTFIFGILDFRWRYVMLATFVGAIPEAYVLSKFVDPGSSPLGSTITTLTVITIFCLLPGFIIEYISRKRGSSLWVRMKAMWNELKAEVKYNNQIVKRNKRDPDKIPIVLLYGYFSSRKSLTVLERILTRKGFEVISFNLGGLMGVFFTKGIPETAKFLDYKLKRQFERHNFDKVHVVAHSKGGLVGLWWILKLGGSKYCKKIITLGSPYSGSFYAWLGLTTPLGLVYKDIWQMRPGSNFLKILHELEIPKDVKIYNIFSKKDGVARGDKGWFKPLKGSEQIVPVPMNHLSHFELLHKRDVGQAIINILGSPYLKDQ